MYLLKIMIKWFLIFMFIICCIAVITVSFMDEETLKKDICLDDGHVWDDKEKRCRPECIALDDDGNCVALTSEERKSLEDCRYNKCERSISDEEWLEICKRNQKPYNAKTLECNYTWTPKDCFKLEGDWVYPDICNS